MITLVLVELALAVVAGVLFVAYYAWTTRGLAGGPAVRAARRHMIAVSAAMAAEAAALFALGAGAPVPVWVFAVVVGLIDVVVVQRLLLLWRARNRAAVDEEAR